MSVLKVKDDINNHDHLIGNRSKFGYMADKHNEPFTIKNSLTSDSYMYLLQQNDNNNDEFLNRTL